MSPAGASNKKLPSLSRSLSPKSSPLGEAEREEDDERDLTGEAGGDGEVLLLEASFTDVGRAFIPARYSSALCSRFVFGETSSVGFALRCCCSVVFGIFSVLWQKKVVAVEFVKFDCLKMALCRTEIERKLKGN